MNLIQTARRGEILAECSIAYLNSPFVEQEHG